ncbi:hypothetical protein ACIBL3_44645 [Kribbella sp. NPDC050124]|uniref:hypothetical protein n=1 Tax=Kribbella sp. NPDC050124 TaxID=3364114 RepID=UPI0037AD85B9
MTAEVDTRGRPGPGLGLPWLVRRWPTSPTIGPVLLTGFGLDRRRDLTTLPILLAPLAGLDQTAVLSLVAAGFIVLGALPQPAVLALPTAATVVALTTLLAPNANPVLDGSLLAAGLFRHAAWNLSHHRADKIVTPIVRQVVRRPRLTSDSAAGKAPATA